jgi:uncharacterized NAD(P)/FAD-binding protein YdhS
VVRAPGIARERTVAIVGAGASGTLAAVNLLRRGHTRVLLIDPGHPGLGLAYRTRDERHLLNIPAGGMSGLADEPADFVDWCHTRGMPVDPADFLPRRLFGEYLQALLVRFGDPRLQIIRSHVRSVEDSLPHGHVRVTLDGGRVIPADAAILAVGSPPPRPIATRGTPAAVVNDPWGRGVLRRLASARDVAIIGTGLTAVDLALSARAANPRVRVTAVSRHGLLPRAHLERAGTPRTIELGPGSSLEHIATEVQLAIRASPSEWRDVVDGLRALSSGLWQGLELTERERFEHELRSCWQVHRHRMAPTVASQVSAMLEVGALSVHAGGVDALHELPEAGARLELCDGSSIRADVLINATGPARLAAAGEPLISRLGEPLISRLIARGRAVPDALGVGVATSPNGALVDRQGVASTRCFTLGPPRRGELFESTAIPEIREQAASLASLLDETLEARQLAGATLRSP